MNLKGNNITWTDGQVGKLRTFWKKGLSAREISKLIDKSRSAVLGKIKRLQIKRNNMKNLKKNISVILRKQPQTEKS